MTTDEQFMYRCLQLAKNGFGYTAPNPMVGAVLAHKGVIIGEGYHIRYGEPHAEPNAINSVEDKSLLTGSTLYVSLEPCSHFGKTPPCAALIIEKEIPRVVIGSVDPNPKVAGRGIKMLEEAGVEVVYGLLDSENKELNKRFFTFHEKKRPYIFLKWAQSTDGFIDSNRKDNTTPPIQFSTVATQTLNHKTRSEEAAILVGTNTVLMDNPQLTTRLWTGKNPLRLAIDRTGKITADYKILNTAAPTIIFTEILRENNANISFVKLDFSQNIFQQIVKELYKRNINSLIVEGGQKLIQGFIDQGLWDEARVEIASVKLGDGILAPQIPMTYFEEETSLDGNKFIAYKNQNF